MVKEGNKHRTDCTIREREEERRNGCLVSRVVVEL
jgi:hypothetical protein